MKLSYDELEECLQEIVRDEIIGKQFKQQRQIYAAFEELEAARRVVETMRDTRDYLNGNAGLNSIPANSKGHKEMQDVIAEYDEVLRKAGDK